MNPLHILLVEDSKTLQMMFTRRHLKDTPHTIDLAEHGHAGLEKFSSASYDVVFMDMEMPVMDGYEATRRIRALEQERGLDPVPIIALSAHDDPAKIAECHQAGCTAYIQKNQIDRDVLTALLARHAPS